MADTPGRRAGAKTPPEDVVQEAVEESFPASDPPAWTAARAGAPRDEPKAGAAAETRPRRLATAEFAADAEAQAAADALLAAGFAAAEVRPAGKAWRLSVVCASAMDEHRARAILDQHGARKVEGRPLPPAAE